MVSGGCVVPTEFANSGDRVYLAVAGLGLVLNILF